MQLNFILAALLAGSLQPSHNRCGDMVLPGSAVCHVTTSGIVIAADQQQASEAAGWAEAAEGRFRRHFGDVPPYTLFLGRDFGELERAAHARGDEVVLLWPTDAERRVAQQAAVRSAFEGRLRETGTPEAEIPARLDEMLRRMSVTSAVSGNVDVVPHELGHGLFIKRFWPGFKGAAGHYGGPAPDWLDEAAALMMETDATAAGKRGTFREIWDADPTVRDLASFLERDHPMRGRMPSPATSGPQIVAPQAPPGAPRSGALILGPPGGGPVTVAISEATSGRTRAGVPITPGIRFYTQSRAVADFLIHRSGNPRILAEISAAVSSGRSMREWLAANGSRARLGGSPAELQQLWEQWVASLPAPAPAPVKAVGTS